MVDPRLATLELSLAALAYAAAAVPRRRRRSGTAEELGTAPTVIELDLYDRDGKQHVRSATESLLIGRSPSAAIRLADPTVSRLHARIQRRGAHAYVEDLGSRNGTLLNGTPIAREAPLSPGDRVRVGSAEIVFVGLGEWK